MVRARPGFTLVEVIVSLVLFTVALLGLAAVAALGATSLNQAIAQERIAREAAALLDSLTFSADAAPGEAIRDGVRYEWTAAAAAGADILVTATVERGPRPLRLELRGRRIQLPAATPASVP